MGNGLITSSGKLEVEDVGEEVWNELYKRSLFLEVDEDQEKMFMHDLVYDLARSIIEEESHIMEAKSSSIIPKQKIRHATLVSSSRYDIAFPEALRGQQKLHSIVVQSGYQYIKRETECEFSCEFKNFGSLRIFDVSGVKMMQLSKSIGSSKHLTYVNLSLSLIIELPESICSLQKLQTLNLNSCRMLRRLPKKMHHLKALRHFFLLGCDNLEGTPPKLGKLTQLKTMSLFVVGESHGQRLGELHHLDVGGKLRIEHLERVRNPTEAREANLARKKNLRDLSLLWGDRSDSQLPEDIVEQEVIEALKPHANIQDLTIEYYMGREFPVWMSDQSVLRNVVSISISHCSNCMGLPALWNLTFLKLLSIKGMDKMEYMFQYGRNFGGGCGSSARVFLSLEEIWIDSNPNLKGLSMEEDEVTSQQFPRLRKINTSLCPQLTLPMLPGLGKFDIVVESASILNLLASTTGLTSLRLSKNKDMVSFPDKMLQNLTLLRSLDISYFSALKVLPENMSGLVALETLAIISCSELECLPDGGIASLKSLKVMLIWDCPKIVFLPDSIQNLTQLKDLNLLDCSPELKRRCEEGKGQDWYKIAHIPYLKITTS